MNEYLNDILLILSVIAAPIILGVLLYYGMTISERRNHDDSEKRRTESGPAKARPAPRDRRAKEPPNERSARPLEVPKQRTGTNG